MRWPVSYAFSLLFLLLSSACATYAPRAVDTLRIGVWSEPDSLNPMQADLTVDVFLASLAFDGLMTSDSNAGDVPDLAAEVPTLRNRGISKDGLTIRYRLRKNVRWQDGAPFTSADVKFSWQAVMNPLNNSSPGIAFNDVSSIDTPGRYSVVFHLKKPYAPFVDTVGNFAILPAHLLARYRSLNDVPFNRQPIGTGPFRVERWVRGEYVEYVANDRYFRGSPKLRRIRVSFIPNDNTLEIKVRAHEIDLAPQLTPTVYEALRHVSGFRGVAVPHPALAALAMNTTRPALNDIRVRRAIAYGVDKRGLVRDLLFGTGDVATSDIEPYYRWAYDPNVRTYEYNPAKAQQLLNDAGWLRGPNGIRVKHGKRLSLQIVFMSGSQSSVQIGVFVQSALARIGIDAPIRTYPAGVLYGTTPGSILRTGKFDINTIGWVGSSSDPDDSEEWMCDEAPPAGANYSRYCNPQVDAQERIALTHIDRRTRKRAYRRIQEMLAEDVPFDFTYYPRLLCILSSRLQHFAPNGISIAWNAYQWSL